MENKSIYISGPIGNAGKCTPEQQIVNVQNGEDIYGALIAKGYAPMLPHLSYYPDKRWRDNGTRKFMFDHATWLNLDKQHVWNCKYFYYMLPEIYGESKGAKMEYEWAKMWGKRIFTNLDEVPSKHEITV
jgi:hypothetical protein